MNIKGSLDVRHRRELSNGGMPGCFGAEGGVFFVFTGTAANVLGLSLLLRPFEAVICAESAHLNVDECGAPERVLGAKLLTVATPDGKLTPGRRRSEDGRDRRVTGGLSRDRPA